MKSEIIQLYVDREDVTLTTYILDESPELAGGNRPAVLICPGGAYMGCSDREGEPVAMKFLSMGYQAYVLRYSTYFKGNMHDVGFGEIKVQPETAYPKPMLEIGMAMLAIREHADAWRTDISRVAVCGFSAGAHNAAMFSVYYDQPVVTKALAATADEIRPAAAILGYCLSDYCFMKKASADPQAMHFFNSSNTAYLGTPAPSEELLQEVSPAQHVSESTPPMFLWATSADSMVPVQNTILMAKALADKKIPFEVHIFEEGPHGLSLATQASASAHSEMNSDASKWTDLCDAWLLKRFQLIMPEKTSFEELKGGSEHAARN